MKDNAHDEYRAARKEAAAAKKHFLKELAVRCKNKGIDMVPRSEESL